MSLKKVGVLTKENTVVLQVCAEGPFGFAIISDNSHVPDNLSLAIFGCCWAHITRGESWMII